MKGSTMNPLIQPKQTTPVFVVALLLVGFATTQSAMGQLLSPIPKNDPTPNHRDFRVNVVKFVPVPCAGENVQLRGELELHFKTITNDGVTRPKPESAVLKVTGTGQSSGRTYVANSSPSVSKFEVTKQNLPGVFVIKWNLKFNVVGNANPQGQADVCPGCVRRFTLKYHVEALTKAKVVSTVAEQEVLCP
jgi:hypothetical protein